MEKIKNKNKFTIKYSFITTPLIDAVDVFNHKEAKIFLNGKTKKSEVWAESDNIIDIALDDLIMVLEKYDKQISIKLLVPVGKEVNTPYHPSDPNWAYIKISLDKIPSIRLSKKDLKEIRDELKKLKNSCW